MANCTGIGELGKEEGIGNTITGADWNTRDTRELLLRLGKEATVGMVARSMGEVDPTDEAKVAMEEVDTKVMKDVRV